MVIIHFVMKVFYNKHKQDELVLYKKEKIGR